jgi:hypothetical protein
VGAISCGREVREQLSEEQFLDLVGVTAIANVVCRLGMVLEET